MRRLHLVRVVTHPPTQLGTDTPQGSVDLLPNREALQPDVSSFGSHA